MGLCGADDSVDPALLGLISEKYPFVEWGVLFRPDKEGEPRYATMGWVREKLHPVFLQSNGSLRLAAHFCGVRVNEVLSGDDTFVREIAALGFRRIQINATAVNGVDTSNLPGAVPIVAALMAKNLGVEFIIQRSDETEPLWGGLAALADSPGGPKNMSMLFDESKGTGKMLASYTPPPAAYEIGYAGGIGPKNIGEVLDLAIAAGQGRSVWIDMESRLRGDVDGRDTFDVAKCFECVRGVCAKGLYKF